MTEKICGTCAHFNTEPTLEPCVGCGRGSVPHNNWQAVIVKKAAHPIAPDILSAAEKHMRERAATYDKPEGERSMAQTVTVFNAFHGTSLTEAQGWHFMQILKDVRLFTRPGYHADSAEDGVAYAGLKAEAKAKE